MRLKLLPNTWCICLGNNSVSTICKISNTVYTLESHSLLWLLQIMCILHNKPHPSIHYNFYANLQSDKPRLTLRAISQTSSQIFKETDSFKGSSMTLIFYVCPRYFRHRISLVKRSLTTHERVSLLLGVNSIFLQLEERDGLEASLGRERGCGDRILLITSESIITTWTTRRKRGMWLNTWLLSEIMFTMKNPKLPKWLTQYQYQGKNF